MNNVQGIQGVSAPKAVQSIDLVPSGQELVSLGEVSDVVEISTASILAAKIHDVPEMRMDLVARVRMEIETGVYETDERIDVTIDRLMDELLGLS